MNFTFVYCGACLLFCIVCIVQKFRSNQPSEDKVSALFVSKLNVLVNFSIFFLLTFIAPVVTFYFLKKILSFCDLKEPDLALSSMLLTQLITLMYIIWLRKHWKVKNNFLPLKNIFQISLVSFGWIFPITLITSCLWIAVLWVLKNCGFNIIFEEQSTVVLFSQLDCPLFKFLFSVIVVFIAPFIEEYVFRAGIYRILKGSFSKKFAAFCASMVFAGMHVNLVSLLPLFVLSLLLIEIYENSGNIYVPIVVHGAFNLNSILLLLFSIPS